jgi:hypothetical protein
LFAQATSQKYQKYVLNDCYNLFLGMIGNAGFSAQVCSSKIKQEPVLALLSWLGS